jgi:hypothetical protein
MAASVTITVFKDPTCMCCNGWIEHLRANGFQVDVKEVQGSELRETKTKYGIPPNLQSCHTALIDGYVIEGHVPAAEILRLLKERPNAKGIVVPGMPVGSPGMEGSPRQSFTVLLLDSSDRTTIYREYPAK